MKISVRYRPDRKYLQLAYTDPLTGKVRTKSSGTSDPKQAEREAEKWESELRGWRGSGPTSWSNFRRRFEDEHLSTVKDSTAQNYGISLDRFQREMGSVRDIRAINSSLISQYKAKLRRAGLAQDSIGTKMRDLKAALRWAVRMGLLDKEPLIDIPARGGSRGRALSFTEVILFFRTIPKEVPKEDVPSVVSVVKIMWLSGLRLSEALEISYSPKSKIYAGLEDKIPSIHWRHGSHKAKRETVTCMPPDFYRFLVEHKKNYGATKKVVQTGLSKRHIQDHLKVVGRNAGIKVSETKYATAHDFRRTFGTRTALRVHPFVLKHLMRHRDIQTTMKYYLNLQSDEIGRQLWDGVHGDVQFDDDRVLKPRGPRKK